MNRENVALALFVIALCAVGVLWARHGATQGELAELKRQYVMLTDEVSLSRPMTVQERTNSIQQVIAMLSVNAGRFEKDDFKSVPDADLRFFLSHACDGKPFREKSERELEGEKKSPCVVAHTVHHVAGKSFIIQKGKNEKSEEPSVSIWTVTSSIYLPERKLWIAKYQFAFQSSSHIEVAERLDIPRSDALELMKK